tara:strand:+ start:122 stop:709 length:588 start_codon:yes stop_codon:yes gene_type:complete
MTYRVRRKFTCSKFYIDNFLCKVFIKPLREYKKGYWQWEAGFVVGKSNRQMNDWFRDKQNKRARAVRNKMTGRVGMKAIKRGFEEILKLRWLIKPGECLTLDCTSGNPDKQFRAWSRWHKYHPEWVIDYENKTFTWFRPPYLEDSVWNSFDIQGINPEDLLANTYDIRYFDSFRVQLKNKSSELTEKQLMDLMIL